MRGERPFPGKQGEGAGVHVARKKNVFSLGGNPITLVYVL